MEIPEEKLKITPELLEGPASDKGPVDGAVRKNSSFKGVRKESERHHSNLELSEEIALEMIPDSPNCGYKRVMSYYSPLFYALLSIVASILASLAFPLFGLFFSELLFVIMLGDRNPNFDEDAYKYLSYFLYLAVGMGVVGAL
jgi:hypothetical protein